MELKLEDLISFENELKNYKIIKYDEIPDIDLYMDQTLAFLNKRLSILKRNEDEILVTASMINNYVKAGIIPAPVAKKYTKRHLAYIVTVCFLKQVLSMNEIKTVIDFLVETKGERNSYDFFCECVEKSLNNCCKVTETVVIKNEESDKDIFSIYYAANALANKIYAQRCIFLQNKSLSEKKMTEIKKELEKKDKN